MRNVLAAAESLSRSSLLDIIEVLDREKPRIYERVVDLLFTSIHEKED